MNAETQIQVEKAIEILLDQDKRVNLIIKMETYGGGFVKTLAKLIRKADRSNLHKIGKAFFDYILVYTD